MIKPKHSSSPPLEDEIMTARTKKIHELSGVLEKQKMKVKELLVQQKERDQKRKKDEVQPYKPQDQHSRQQCTEVYQRICTQIIDIGNRVLPSARRQNKLNELCQAEVKSPQDSARKEEDKQLDYLKSEQYLMYLEGITKEGGGARNLIKKMKEARNHQTYLNERKSPSSRTSASPSPSPRQFFRDTAVSHLPNLPQVSYSKRIQPLLINNQTLLLNQKSLQDEMQKMKISSPKKTLTYTPTMKDINEGIVTPQKKKEQPLNNIKIQSKTIQYVLEGRTPFNYIINTPLSDVKDRENLSSNKSYFPSNKISSWKPTLALESKQPISIEKQPSISKLQQRDNKRSYKLMEKKCLENNKFTDYSPFKIRNKSPHNFKIYAENNEEQYSSTFNINDHFKENGYKIDFKLQCPTTKTKQKLKKEKKQLCDRSYSPHLLSNRPSHKVVDSETTSTVTYSDQTPPKISKLTLVTPSRLKSKRP